MNHFILTRFNLRLWTRDKHSCPTQTDDWLKRRFDFFETYCLPSIQAQSCKGFCWIILIDSETPDVYRERLANDTKGIVDTKIIRVNPEYGWTFATIFSQVINKYIDKQSERIVTTYLDSDDALMLDYVERICKVADSIPQNTFITFAYGLQYFTRYNAAIKVKFPNNHFISLVESVKDGELPRTVYGYGGHGNIYKHQNCGVTVKTLLDKDELGWLEIVHEQNVVNDFKMRLYVRPVCQTKILQNFGINKDIDTSISLFFFKLLPHGFHVFLIRVRQKLDGIYLVHKRQSL